MNAEDYRRLFLSEARERLGTAFELLETDDPPPLELMRQAHSLKGMAATLGFPTMVALAHALEDLLEDPGEEWHELVGDTLACLGGLVDAIERGESDASDRATALALRIRARATGPAVPPEGRASASAPPERAHDRADDAAEPRADRDDTATADAAGGGDGERPPAPAPGGWPPTAAEHPPTLYRVLLDLAERDPQTGADPTVRVLGNLASLGRVVRVHPPQLSTESGRFNRFLQVILEAPLAGDAVREILLCETGIAEVAVSEEARAADPPRRAREVASPWVRVRSDLLDRALEAGLATLSALKRRRAAAGEAPDDDDAARAESRAHETWRALWELRLVPFDTLTGRLRQAIREAAAERGKRVRLAVENTDVRLDRGLLEELAEPLLHLVRNAVDHGIEPPDERAARGKARAGRLQLAVERRGERVRIRLADDGRGIDAGALRRKAVELGWLDADAASALTERDALELIARPGFTTRAAADTVSGRGMGMDIVRERVERVGGRLEISTEPGYGTSMTLDLPLGRSLLRVLLFRCGDGVYAVPQRHVRAVALSGADAVLADLWGVDSDAAPDQRAVLFVEGRGGRRGVAVDAVLEERDLVVRPLGPPLQALRRYAGASVLEDGTVVLVVDPAELARETDPGAEAAGC